MSFEELIKLSKDNNELSSPLDYSRFIIRKGVAENVCHDMQSFDEYASWAIWDDSGKFDYKSKDIFLMTGCVLVAYNPSSKAIDPSTGKKIPWGSFHKMKTNQTLSANDTKLKNAILNTKLRGCYITDIIKNHCGSRSNLIKDELTEKDIEQNVDVFLYEMNKLGNVKLLVAIGNETFSLLAENPRINDQYKIIKIPHYSARKYNRADDYVKEISNCLKKYGLAD